MQNYYFCLDFEFVQTYFVESFSPELCQVSFSLGICALCSQSWFPLCSLKNVSLLPVLTCLSAYLQWTFWDNIHAAKPQACKSWTYHPAWTSSAVGTIIYTATDQVVVNQTVISSYIFVYLFKLCTSHPSIWFYLQK